MAEEIVLKEIEVQKLRLRPGDVVIFSLPKDTKHSYLQRFAQNVARILPRNPCMIVADDVKISVAAQEEKPNGP